MRLQRYNVKAGKDTDTLDVTVTGTGTERAVALRQPDAALAKVIENRVLTNGGISEKRHIGKSLWNSGGDTDIDCWLPLQSSNYRRIWVTRQVIISPCRLEV